MPILSLERVVPTQNFEPLAGDLPTTAEFAAMSEVAADTVAPHVRNTRVYTSQELSSSGTQVMIKDESQQRGGNFKVFGAFNALSIARARGAERFATASAGNHAIALALAVAELGGSLDVTVPEGTPDSKLEQIRGEGVTFRVEGKNFGASNTLARARSEEEETDYISPFADADVIAGQGALALGLLEQVPDVEIALIPIGGGGLGSGFASVLKHLRPNVQVIGVQAMGCSAFVDSVRAGELRPQADPDKRFGGLAVSEPDPMTLAIGERTLDMTALITRDEVYETIHMLHREHGIVYEEAGAVAPTVARQLAMLPEFAGAKIVAVATGANPGKHVKQYAAAVARRIREDQQYGRYPQRGSIGVIT